MKNVNSLTYEGVVKLKIINDKSKKIKKSITIHNNGTDNLFFFLCKCLAKQYDSLLAPLALDASSSTYDEKSPTSLSTSLAYRVLLSPQGVIAGSDSKIAEGTSYAYVTRFSAIIPFSSITSGKNTLKCFQLCSSLSQNDKVGSLLAYINIPEGVSITSGEALLVEWNMGFKNPTSSTTATE